MRERSEAVRVFTHPATWKSRKFVEAGIGAPASRSNTTRPLRSADSPFVPTSSCCNYPSFFRSIPRTCTVADDFEYSISSEFIQRLICKPISRVAACSSPWEIT